MNFPRFYLVELILALEYLHLKANVLHGDVKPCNVLINADGHIKLGDFGNSKSRFRPGERREYAKGGTRGFRFVETLHDY